MPRILIIGGYGVFGSRISERLARDGDLELIVAGRQEAPARNAARALADSSPASVSYAAVDARTIDTDGLARLAPDVVVNASGPYQDQDYRLARVCVAIGAHYIDLADARAFVAGIGALDGAAKMAGATVISGASSVPGLSSVVVATLASAFHRVSRLDYAISPGNSFDPGLATTASILSYVGRPFATRLQGRTASVYGWQGLGRTTFPKVGRRWLGYADIPDLDLFPTRYRDLDTVRFRAGVEVGVFHLGIWALSWLVRAGLVADARRLARPLLSVKRQLRFLGSDRGGMLVVVEGIGHDGAPMKRQWSLAAGSGHGPFVPAIASVILARRLARGQMRQAGAMPCFELFELEDFMQEVRDLDIAVEFA